MHGKDNSPRHFNHEDKNAHVHQINFNSQKSGNGEELTFIPKYYALWYIMKIW